MFWGMCVLFGDHAAFLEKVTPDVHRSVPPRTGRVRPEVDAVRPVRMNERQLIRAP